MADNNKTKLCAILEKVTYEIQELKNQQHQDVDALEVIQMQLQEALNEAMDLPNEKNPIVNVYLNEYMFFF